MFPLQNEKDTLRPPVAATSRVSGGDLDAAIHDPLVCATCLVRSGICPPLAFRRRFQPYAVVRQKIYRKRGRLTYFPAGREVQKPAVGLRIFGTHGQLYLEDTACGVVNIFYHDGGHELLGYQPNRGYYNELLNFYHALQGTEEIAVTPEVEIGDFRTVYAILQSIRDQDIVKVDRTPAYAMG